MADKKKTNVKLPFAIEWGFGIANFFLQMVSSSALSYFAFVMTDVLLLSTGQAATVNSISALTGTTASLVFAAILQYSNLPWGRYRSWIILMVPALCIGTVGMFFPWPFANKAITVMVLCVFYFLYSIGTTAVGSATRTLVTKCSDSVEGRMLIIGRQNVLHNTSRVIGGAILIPIVVAIGGSKTSGTGYFGYFTIFAVMTLIAYMWLAKVVKPYDPYDPNFHAVKANKVSIGDIIKALATNGNLLALFMGTFLQGAFAMSTSLGAYFFTYVCGDLSYYALYNTLSPFGGIIGGLLSPWFSARFDKKKLYIWSMGIKTWVIYPLIALQYFLTGTINPLYACFMLTLGFLIDNLQRTYFQTFWMDCAEYSFWKTKKDITPIVLTISTLPAKIARVISAPLGLLLLGKAGYVAGQAQSPRTILWIVCLYCFVPGFCQLLMCGCLAFGYKLTNEQCNQIMEENNATRAQMKAEAEAAKAAKTE